jgi:hypothetical protein
MPPRSVARARRARAAAAALLGAALAAGCVSIRWSGEARFEALHPEQIESLEPGRTELGECLEAFGSPLYVYEQPAGGFAIAYGWLDGRSTGASLSLPTTSPVDPSFQYDDRLADLRGVVLVFDRDCRLQIVEQGYLRELSPELRRRPAYDDSWYPAPPAQDGSATDEQEQGASAAPAIPAAPTGRT